MYVLSHFCAYSNLFSSRQHCEIEVEASGRVVVTALASQQNSNKLIRINSSEGQPGEILVNGVRNVLRLNDRLTLLVRLYLHHRSKYFLSHDMGFSTHVGWAS